MGIPPVLAGQQVAENDETTMSKLMETNMPKQDDAVLALVMQGSMTSETKPADQQDNEAVAALRQTQLNGSCARITSRSTGSCDAVLRPQ